MQAFVILFNYARILAFALGLLLTGCGEGQLQGSRDADVPDFVWVSPTLIRSKTGSIYKMGWFYDPILTYKSATCDNHLDYVRIADAKVRKWNRLLDQLADEESDVQAVRSFSLEMPDGDEWVNFAITHGIIVENTKMGFSYEPPYALNPWCDNDVRGSAWIAKYNHVFSAKCVYQFRKMRDPELDISTIQRIPSLSLCQKAFPEGVEFCNEIVPPEKAYGVVACAPSGELRYTHD